MTSPARPSIAPPAGGRGAPGRPGADSEQEKLGRLGCEQFNRLFVLMKNSLLFDLANKSMQRPIALFLEGLRAFAAGGETKVSLGIAGESLFLNQALLKPDTATYDNGKYLLRVYRRIRAQEIQFDAACSESDLRTFLGGLKKVVGGGADATLLAEVPSIGLVALSDQAAACETEEIDARVQVLRTFASAVALMARTTALAARGANWSPSLVRRVAYDLTDAAAREPDLLLGLLHAPVAQGRLGAHLVRTAVLALLCSSKAGLPRAAVVEAALVALCHHLPRPRGAPAAGAEEGPEVLEAPVEREDPLGAALALCAHGGLNPGLIRRVIGVYETSTDPAGLRDRYREAEPTDLLARLVSLADSYDVLSTEAPPDEALRLLLTGHSAREPTLSRVFVNTVGVYPVGTVVTLESGARAVVVEAPRRREQLTRPVVHLLDGHAVVDLSREGHGHGGIAGTLDAAAERLNVSHYFLL